MEQTRTKRLSRALVSFIAAFALALCMLPAAAITASTEAQAATVQSADYSSTLTALTGRFAQDGTDASIGVIGYDKNTWTAAPGLNAAGMRDQVDTAALIANLSSQENPSAGLLAKYILALQSAGIDCTAVQVGESTRNLIEEMETATSAEFAGYTNIYDMVLVLPVYSAFDKATFTDAATYNVSDIAAFIAGNIPVDVNTAAQALLALAPYKTMSAQDASEFGFTANELEEVQTAISSIENMIESNVDEQSGGIMEPEQVWGDTTYPAYLSIDSTAWAVAALCAAGGHKGTCEQLVSYLASQYKSHDMSYTGADGVWTEPDAAASALMGIAAFDTYLSEGAPVNVYTAERMPFDESADKSELYSLLRKVDSFLAEYGNKISNTVLKQQLAEAQNAVFDVVEKADATEVEVASALEALQNAYEAAKNSGTWKKDSKGWWYQYLDGTYPKSCWKTIDGKRYYFNASGYMATGWQKVSGKWYYLGTSGAMVTNWQKISGKWYYFNGDGAMQAGWQQIGDTWYYFNSSGAMLTGWQKISGTWYYFASSGAMKTGWQKISGKWYWFNDDGAMKTGWLQDGSTWYYFKSGGAMVTGWQKVGSKWYWFSGSGAMATGWQSISGSWYYFGSNGAMWANTTTPDGSYVNSNGVYSVFWVPNGSVYHKTKNCAALSRSRDIRSGTIAQSGKSRACKDCFH